MMELSTLPIALDVARHIKSGYNRHQAFGGALKSATHRFILSINDMRGMPDELLNKYLTAVTRSNGSEVEKNHILKEGHKLIEKRLMKDDKWEKSISKKFLRSGIDDPIRSIEHGHIMKPANFNKYRLPPGEKTLVEHKRVRGPKEPKPARVKMTKEEQAARRKEARKVLSDAKKAIKKVEAIKSISNNEKANIIDDIINKAEERADNILDNSNPDYDPFIEIIDDIDPQYNRPQYSNETVLDFLQEEPALAQEIIDSVIEEGPTRTLDELLDTNRPDYDPDQLIEIIGEGRRHLKRTMGGRRPFRNSPLGEEMEHGGRRHRMLNRGIDGGMTGSIRRPVILDNYLPRQIGFHSSRPFNNI
jgi:hypothetical protein